MNQRVLKPIVLLLLFFLLEANGQEILQITGKVTDSESGEPVESALVELLENGRYTLTDAEGRFQFQNLESGLYHIRVTRLGYQSHHPVVVLVEKGTTNRLALRITPEPFQLAPVVVTQAGDVKRPGTLGIGQVLGPEELRAYRNEDFAEVLQKVAGLEVLTPSGKGGPAKVAIHGGSSRQVLVLLDGIRLNNPQTGEVDLSLVDVRELEKIEVIRQGNAAVFGNQAFDGVVRLFSKKADRKINYQSNASLGSFETAEAGLRAGSHWKHVSFKGGYNQNWSRQNYSYTFQNEKLVRKNAWFRNRNWFTHLSGETGRVIGKLLLYGNAINRGLPSTPFNEQIPANPAIPFNPHLQQASHQLQGHLKIFTGKSNLLELRSGWQQLSQHAAYADEAVPRKLRYDTRQLNRQMNTAVDWRLFHKNEFEFRFGGEWLWEYLKQENKLAAAANPAIHKRKSYSIYSDFKLPVLKSAPGISQLDAVGAIRFQKYFSDTGEWYPYVGLSLVPSFLTEIRIFANYSQGVRYPDFNSLFWVGDARAQGNPDLLPEKKTGRYLQIYYQPARDGLMSIDFSAFTETVDNLIFWHRRFDGVWEPRNEARVKKWGWDLKIVQPILPNCFDLSVSYSRLFTRNEKDDPIVHGKKLIFAPENTWHLALRYTDEDWVFLADFRQVSEKETVISNSKGTQIPAFKVMDLSANRRFPLSRKIDLELGVQIKNLTDEDYQLILGYPMPGRAFYVHMQMKLKS